MKRITSILLSIAMLLSFVPTMAFAQNDVDTTKLTAEEYAEWKANLIQQKSISLMSLDDVDAISQSGYIRNDFVEAYINESGHYTMGTTGGNPDSSSDNNKLLLYGHPGSSTTETLIVVDGEETYFNSNNISISQNQATATAMIDDVEVKQILTLENNSYTGNADVVSIKYVLTNKGSSSKQIGGRIMLDTMLGNNDGAPFRLPNHGNVVTELELSGNAIPEYWQAFDNLSNPNVISTGNFYRTDSEKPDKVQFAHWGSIQGSSWNYQVTSGNSVTGDSAVAAYFNPRTVLAGQSRSFVTYYGISDFSLSDFEGDLSVSINAPLSVGGNSSAYNNNPFNLTAYIGNNTDSTINNVKAIINLPSELEIEGSDSNVLDLGNINAGAESVAKWRIRAIPQDTTTTATYSITVIGDGVESKTVTNGMLLYNTDDLYRTITFNLNGGEGTTPAPQNVLIGTKGTEPPKPRRTGYVFTGWYANPECTGISWFSFLNAGALLRTTENITLYAGWSDRQMLTYGRDTFNFENTNGDFFGGWNNFWGNTHYKLSGDYYDVLLRGQNNRQDLIDFMNEDWGGSCFGMSCVLALLKSGDLDERFFQEDATRAFDFEKPKDSKTIFNLINYYMIMQSTNTTSRARGNYNRSVETSNNRNLVETVKNSSYPVVLGFDIMNRSNNTRNGGHAVIAYDVVETEDVYNVAIWDPNDQNNSPVLRVSKDYTTSSFVNTWYDDATHYSYIKYALDVEGKNSSYDYRNIQDELVRLGRSSGAEAVSLMEYQNSNEEFVEMTLNYDNFVIESSDGKTAEIVNGSVVSGDLEIEYVDILNEFGQELKIKYIVPILPDGEYYLITPSETQTSIVTGEPLSQFITKITDNSAEGFYTKINTDNTATFKITCDGSVNVQADTSINQNITMSKNNSITEWNSITIEANTNDMSVAYEDDAIVISSDNTTANITVADDYNEIEFDNVQISNDSINITENNGTCVVADREGAELASDTLGKSVVFYSLGGDLIDALSNVPVGSTIEEPEAPERTGFIFDGWYLTTSYMPSELWDFENNTVDTNTRLYAKWLADETFMYSVTFKAEGFDDIIVLVEHGQAVDPIPAVPEKVGCVGQWDVSDLSNITSNMVVNAIYDGTPEKAVAPIASTASGKVTSGTQITLSTSTSGANIYYTIDGSEPTSSSNLYSAPITITSATTIKAIAVKTGMLNSDITELSYTIKSSGGGGGGGGTSSYAVKFETNGGTTVKSVSAKKNTAIDMPTAPTKEGFIFDGWYTDKELTKKYDFSSKITKTITLYAKWVEEPEITILLTIGKKDTIINGKTVENDVAPKIVNDRTMLPIRFIAEALGAKVEWFGDTSTVKITAEGIEISLVIGDNFAMVNGEKVELDSPSFVENDRTYLPIRFVAENLGANVEWDQDTQTVSITK